MDALILPACVIALAVFAGAFALCRETELATATAAGMCILALIMALAI